MLRQLAKRLSFSVSTCVFLTLWSLPCFAAEVIEITADNWKSICPTGKEVDWNFGDFVLRNDKIVAVIAKPVQTRNANMTVRKVVSLPAVRSTQLLLSRGGRNAHSVSDAECRRRLGHRHGID